MKKFIGYIVIILLFGGSICGLVFGIKYGQQQKQIDNLYTEEEVEEKYQEYVETIDNFQVQIDDLNGQVTVLLAEKQQQEEKISSLQTSINENDTQISSLTSEKQELQSQIENLNAQISEKDEQISSLTAENGANEEEIAQLQSEKSALESQVSDLTQNVEDYEEHVASLNSQIDTLNEQISSLTADCETKASQIETLQADKSSLQTKVNDLTEQVSSKDQQIITLTSEKQSLQTQVDSLTGELSDKTSQISTLTEQVSTLQAEIERLNTLVEDYENILNDTHTVNFYNGDDLYATKAVKHEERVLDPQAPTKAFSRFVGWSSNKVDVVDLSSFSIVEDTSFYAMFELELDSAKILTKIEGLYSCGDLTLTYFNVDEKVLVASNSDYAIMVNFEETEVANTDQLFVYISKDTCVEYIAVSTYLSSLDFSGSVKQVQNDYSLNYGLEETVMYVANYNSLIQNPNKLTEFRLLPKFMYIGDNGKRVETQDGMIVTVKESNRPSAQNTEMVAISALGDWVLGLYPIYGTIETDPNAVVYQDNQI